MLSAFVPAMSVGAATLEGKGTELSPFIACDEATLQMIADFPDAYWQLSNDIEVTSTWSAIGTSGDQFSGTLDGNGYKITGLHRSVAAYTYPRALFIENNYGTIKNLHLEGTFTIATPSGGGLLAEYNYGTIENCSVSGKITVTQSNWTSNEFGGMVYKNASAGIIKNCYAKVDFVKTVAVESNATVRICGMLYDNDGTIINCYTVGTRSVPVTISSKIGYGFAYTGDGTSESCYYDKEVSGCSDTKFANGKTTAAMKMEYNYTNWDFNNTWAIDESVNDGYPYLQCERSVVVAMTGFALEEAAVSVAEGGTVTLTPVFTPQNASDKTVEWSTSNRYVATVSDGVVTALAEGTAVITATASGIAASCTVTVTSAEETPGGTFGDNLTWSYENGTLTIGGSGDMPNVSYESAPWAEYLDEITTVVLGAGITKIPTDVFCDCTNLESIAADSANAVFASVDGVLFSKDMSVLYAYPQNKADVEYTIPSSVQKIAYGAFYLNYTLEKLYIPDTVTEIESYAICLCGFTIYASAGSEAEEYVTEFNASSSVKLNFVSTSQSADAEYNVETVNYESLGNNRYRVWGSFTREKTETDGEVVFIIALYGESGEMIDFIFIETSLEEGQSAKIGGVLKGENATAIKAFVWNSFDEMTSLGNSAEKVL